jgi:hypothetical protein
VDRLKVFVSSRTKELEAERAAVKESIEELKFAAILFENEPASGKRPDEASLELVDAADVIVLLLGFELSAIVRREYERAVERKIGDSILVFIKAVPHNSEMSDFISKIEDRHKRVRFHDETELRHGVHQALVGLVSSAVRRVNRLPGQEVASVAGPPPAIRVSANTGVLIMDQTVGDLLFFVEAVNAGLNSVILSNAMELEVPGGKRWVLPTAESSASFPHELRPGRNCAYWVPVQGLAHTLRDSGFSGKVSLKAVFRDTLKREYSSAPFDFDVELGLRGVQSEK